MQTRKASNRNRLIKAAARLIEKDGYKNIDVTKVTKEAVANLDCTTDKDLLEQINQILEAKK